jgi:hypothetical protein
MGKWTRIEKVTTQGPRMPFIHGTDSYALRATSGLLEASKCPVFGEELLYFFYGRPGYRVAAKVGSRSDMSRCPVCFVFKPDIAIPAKRVYPFDTGAFDDGMFNGFRHPGMGLESFLLGSSLDLPQKVVEYFFGSNRSYYFGALKSDLTFDFDEMEIQAYYDLIRLTGETEYDDRRYTIEVQLENSLQVEGNVIAVVLPNAALQSANISGTILSKWRALPITYNTYQGTRPAEYNAVVREQLLEFLSKRGYL